MNQTYTKRLCLSGIWVVHSQNKRQKMMWNMLKVIDAVLVFLLLTVNIFQTFLCFYCWIWTGIWDGFSKQVGRPMVYESEKRGDNLFYSMTLVAISNNVFVVFWITHNDFSYIVAIVTSSFDYRQRTWKSL